MATDPIGDTLQNMLGDKGMVTGYYVVAEFIGESGQRHWLADYPEEQTVAYSIGLIEWARLGLAAEATDYFQTLAALQELAAEEEEEDDGDR